MLSVKVIEAYVRHCLMIVALCCQFDCGAENEGRHNCREQLPPLPPLNIAKFHPLPIRFLYHNRIVLLRCSQLITWQKQPKAYYIYRSMFVFAILLEPNPGIMPLSNDCPSGNSQNWSRERSLFTSIWVFSGISNDQSVLVSREIRDKILLY